MLVSSIRSPLSLEACQNNIIPSEFDSSSSSSSSGISPSYHYPEANRCGQIAFEARQLLERVGREGPTASKKITSWTICSLVTVLSVGVAAALSRTSAYRRLLIPVTVIGAIFFFVVCLPTLFGARKELSDLKEAESRFSGQAQSLVNDIFTRLDAVETAFPQGSIAVGVLHTEDLEINQELKENLDRWIANLRLVHGFGDFKNGLEPITLDQSLNQAEIGNLRNLRGDAYVLHVHLPNIIQSIETCSLAIENILDPDFIWPGNTLNESTLRAKEELSSLVGMIHSLRGARAGFFS
jgi:hypothetical protein